MQQWLEQAMKKTVLFRSFETARGYSDFKVGVLQFVSMATGCSSIINSDTHAAVEQLCTFMRAAAIVPLLAAVRALLQSTPHLPSCLRSVSTRCLTYQTACLCHVHPRASTYSRTKKIRQNRRTTPTSGSAPPLYSRAVSSQVILSYLKTRQRQQLFHSVHKLLSQCILGLLCRLPSP